MAFVSSKSSASSAARSETSNYESRASLHGRGPDILLALRREIKLNLEFNLRPPDLRG